MVPVMKDPRAVIDRSQPPSSSSPRHFQVPAQTNRSFRTLKVGHRSGRSWLVIGMALSFMITGAGSVAQAAGVSIHVYDLSTGRQIRSLAGHNRPTTAIAVSADGTLALTASLTPELRLWSIEAGRELRSIDQGPLPGYVGPGASLQFVNGTNQVLIARMQAGVHLWSVSDGTMVQAFKAPFRGASAAMVSADQKTVVAIGGSEMQVAVWGWPKGDPRGVFTEQSMLEPRCVCLARDGKARSWWNAETGEPWPETRPAPTGIPLELSYGDQSVLSPNGSMLVTYGPSLLNSNAQWLHLWDIETGRLLWHHPSLDLPLVYTFRPSATCAAVAFSPDGRRLAIGGRGERVVVLGIDGERTRRELKTPAGASDWVAFLPDGKQLLTWGDKTMRMWDLGSGQLVRSFPVPVLHCLAVTPDSRLLLVGGDREFRGL